LAQRKVTLENAERLEGGRIDGKNFNSFIGNVVFSHQGTLIYCDSAVLYKKDNSLQAFGNVRIDDQDSVTINSDRLFYDGDKQLAMLQDNVVFVKRGQMTLYTDNLDYDRKNKIAYYYDGGRLIDSTNELESKKGYYEVSINMASFKEDVIGTNPDFTLKSDTLQYNTKTKEIFFRDHTEITNIEGEVFVYQSGVYNTLKESSVFYKGYIETPSYFLYGNNLSFDEVNNYYTAQNNVKIVSKDDEIVILGEGAEYYKNEGLIKVYDDALLKMVSSGDTLYLSADTLISIDSEIVEEKRLLAFNHVKIYKTDLQGTADSLAYFQADSVLSLFGSPILWTEGNQLSADSIDIQIQNGTIKNLHLQSNSFIIQADTLHNFNQVKGRSMDAVFQEQQLDKVYVHGNGESIFFMLSDDYLALIGVNKVLCSDITLSFKNGKLFDVMFYTNNEGSFIPPHELKEPDKRLSGFDWQESNRPQFETVVPLRYLKYYKKNSASKRSRGFNR